MESFRINQLLTENPLVLEIGGGNGNTAEVLERDFGAQITIVEPNEKEAKIAKKGLL